MIDPTRFTNFNLDTNGLQEYILFCIAVAGKRAIKTAKLLDTFLEGSDEPFKFVRSFPNREAVRERMIEIGFGCHDTKSKGFWWIAHSELDLKTCSIEELETCPGIGMKSSRYFVMHTRAKERKVACLDTHILKYMRDSGFQNIPKNTPTPKQYFRIEKEYLKICENLNEHPAHLDLKIWNEYAGYS